MNNGVDPIATAQTKARYNRIARFYNLMEWMPERQFKPWREKLWRYARGDVLEVGVGTGKNFDYYPPGVKVTGIELADQMLIRAREYAQQFGKLVELREGDVQALDFPDNSFDTAASTFVFCSVPNPVRGLRELNRVVKPGGQVSYLSMFALTVRLRDG